MLKNVILIIIVVMFGAAGQLLFKIAMTSVGNLSLNIETFIRVASNIYFLTGMAILVIEFLCWLYLLSIIDLNIAVLFASLIPILIIIGSSVILKENIPIMRWIGASVVVVGLVIVAKTW